MRYSSWTPTPYYTYRHFHMVFIQKSYFSIRFYYMHGFNTVSFFPFSTKIDGNNNRRSISKHTQYVPTHTANAAVKHVIRWATTHIQNKHTRIKWVFIFSYWECNSNMESRNRSSVEYTEKNYHIRHLHHCCSKWSETVRPKLEE